ncbi:DUF4306 domain-containing protein [Gracilibacillus phocaeensis]|uniref:DUF4306 domain-containing protein n=1 Tax=Gracilibacillus phocaeensis TaxID=2042304 RepID=UPI001031644E|nr:DUF4306 domain-containing protein [Gracilibacillus phocaeensis]
MVWSIPAKISQLFLLKSRLFVQLLVSFGFFVLSLLAALYEGSYLLEDKSEWQHTTPFTHLLHEHPIFPADISALDFLVYAIKFFSFFPIVCLLSGLYCFMLSLFTMLRKKMLWFRRTCTLIGLLLLISGVLLFSTITIGSLLFCSVMILSGLILVWCTYLLRKTIVR